MSDVGGIAAERLKSFVTRIRNLEAEKKGIGEDVKEVYAEAKGTGFDNKVIRKVIKWMDEHEKSPANQQEQEALLDLYKEALGLTEWTGTNRDIPLNPPKSRSNKARPDQGPSEEDGAQTNWEDRIRQEEEKEKKPEPEPEPEPPPPVTKDEATAMGRQAGEAGVPVAANPFPAGDPNRAVWDAAWCAATGSDGMDLPPELRRGSEAKKGGKKPGKPGAQPPGGRDKGGEG